MDDRLPAVPGDAPIEGTVLNGRELAVHPAPVLHPAAVLVLRHAAFVAAGAVIIVQRRHAHRTMHRRMARTAELSGDHETALKWRQHEAAERHQRHERWIKRIEVAVLAVGTLPVLIICWLALMIVGGLLMAFDIHSFYGFYIPWRDSAHAMAWSLHAADIAWTVAPPVLLATALTVLYVTGRRGGDHLPRWAMAGSPEEQDRGLVLTADTIVLALKNVQITPLKQAFKEDWMPTFTLTPVKDGRGYATEFSLPLGVTPQMIADQRPVLARNLHRDEIEVWPSAGPPGHASLWVADPGAISKSAPAYPLLDDGEADVFAGVPGGVIARGDGALIPVVENSGVFGGLPGQGKSNGGRVLMLGCATDPLCKLDAWVFANNGDFDAYEPRLARYEKGLDDVVIEAAVNRLHELYEDVGRREEMIADLGGKKLSRQMAAEHPELRPHVVLFSECHELFGHPEYGDVAGELAVKTVKRARKTGVSLWFDTQSSRKAAIPGALVELVSVNVCFAVKTWRNNDGFLGDGSFQAGIRATELRPGRDRGTALVTGISDSQFELLKWYYIEADDDTGYDAAAEVIARCMKTVAPGTPVGGSYVPAIEAAKRDLLEDLAELLRGDIEPERLAILAAALQRLAPRHIPYRSLTGVQLRDLLTVEGVRTTNTGNVLRLAPADLREALAAREGGE